MRVEWTEPALGDLESILKYISKDSPENGYRFIERLFDSAASLSELSNRGRHVTESDRKDIRELIFHDYRIIYLVKTAQVDILAVIHSSRDLNHLPKKPWIK
ncbi:MAG: type II toxin-antitoxin system RelE/ParE family toxin [Gammaproteobacteria bacterium]|nr:type II toxin-antitoxin system RelE/ParE family toxin [Gammaproteobacteria bacterium]